MAAIRNTLHALRTRFVPFAGLLLLAALAATLADPKIGRFNKLERSIEPELDGKVVHIADGDTLTIVDGKNAQRRIRLFGIDAPEHGQAFGNKAREDLADKVFGKRVHVDVVDVDRYGRRVGRIYLGDRFINLEMVRDGLAWRYRQFDTAGEFTQAEQEARAARRGLWSDARPIPPWEFRREEFRRQWHHQTGSG